ncbi:hypothetical protein [Halobacterium jilantaiense]|uniref:Uncharacterized protein n=1 Tax=Halobacterium jilantaiense TaxID=355548 RepID=A0A1I0QI18_9EURY|nr:hypothetical protein [Halobacterium jilantaiense]SEW26521.1 hypothetical protein SAMN04487945_2618 [Halobacterium jilantaiense]
MTPRTILGSVLLAAGAAQLAAVPGYDHRESAVVAFAVGTLLVAAGYVVAPQTDSPL